MQKFIVQIIGPSCSGKSTLVSELGKVFPGVYNVAYDKLKWQLAGYHRDQHRELVRQLELGVFEVTCKMGLPILLEALIRDQAEFDEYKTLADKFGYQIISVALTAPQEILLTRFRERIVSAKATGGRVSVTDEALYLSNLQRPVFMLVGTPVFDTSVMSTEEIVDEVSKLIG